MAVSNTIMNMHARSYIAAVFEQRLRQEGFVCPDDKLLCWYRVRNDEVLDTVIFCSRRGILPVEMNIYYEVTPLFTRPNYIKNAYYPLDDRARLDCAQRKLILEGPELNSANLQPFSQEIQVIAPGHGNRGLYSLTDVALPYFDKIQSVLDCYDVHKASRLQTLSWYADRSFNPYFNMSREFMDEVLYVEDRVIYPYCTDCVERQLRSVGDKVAMYPKNREYQEIFQHLQQLKNALEGGRDAYMETLLQREQEYRLLLSKKWGLRF